jgi:DNA-binding NarL/FixJ family response regulator
MPTRIVLVDDHELFRSGLAALLSAAPEYAIVGEADHARAALDVVEHTHPDVVVTDLGLAGENGISLTRQLIGRDDKCKVLVLTASLSVEFASQAFTAGALGYAVKHESPETLLQAISAVASGKHYMTPRLPKETLHAVLGATRRRGPLESLSPREREVFAMLVSGLDNRAIAKQLLISVKTVEVHRTHVLNKLALRSLSELIRFAARHGLLLDAVATDPECH